jgi:KDO2-lipid IV(A) lauroyltransferase
MDASWPNTSAKAVRPSHRLEAWGAALLFGAFAVLPLDCASALGGTIGRLIGPFLGISRQARRNVRNALPWLSESDIEAVIRGMWDNLGSVAAEYPHLKEHPCFRSGRTGPDARL